MQNRFVGLLLLAVMAYSGTAMAMGGNDGWYSVPRHKDAGKFEPWECAFERDNVPPVTPEADAIFQEARSLQKSLPNPKEADKIRIFNLYKQAASMGHWKAMFNLANCYLNGNGTKASVTTADALYDRLMEMGVPAGYYGKYVLTKKGLAVVQDDEEADRLLHMAANLGYPPAQYRLGEYYYITEQRPQQSVAYHICALRQGYSKSAEAIGVYLAIEKNFRMAMEYYWRGTALGDWGSAFRIEDILMSGSDDPDFSYGYEVNQGLSKVFSKYYSELKKNASIRLYDLFQKHPIPENKLMTREQSRAMPSKLKDAFGGKWPDEIFPELAPDYMPPKD